MAGSTGSSRPGRGPAPHGGVTLSDVAARAGVSSQTVSNALNNPARLTRETLERVLAAVAELGYRPNRSARALRNRSSRLIGVKVEAARGDRAALLLDEFLHALAASAGEAGYHLILCQAADDASEVMAYDDLLATSDVDAFVLTGAHRDDPRAAWLRERDVPFASFGRSWDGDDALTWVDVDGGAGVRAATEHLAEQGHTRIGYLGWPDDSEVGRDRRDGWLGACADRGLATDLHAESVDEFDGGVAAGHGLVEAGATAVVCASDTLALGVLRALHQRGLRAGVDVGVTGFDCSPTSALTTPGLTSLRQPLAAVAHALVARLEALLSGAPLDDPHLLLAPELVVRESSLLHPAPHHSPDSRSPA